MTLFSNKSIDSKVLGANISTHVFGAQEHNLTHNSQEQIPNLNAALPKDRRKRRVYYKDFVIFRGCREERKIAKMFYS